MNRFALIGSGLWKMRLFLLVAGGCLAGGIVLMMEPKSEESVAHIQPKAVAVSAASAPSGREEVRLLTGVGFDGASFFVANGMDFDLYDATVELETGVFSSGWTAGIARIPAKNGASIPAVRFQKANGARFSAGRDEASYARVSARNKAGAVFRSASLAIKAVR